MSVAALQEKTSAQGMTLTQAGMLTVAAYIAAQILADVGSLKIAWVAGFSVDGGTFIYPLTFTLRDMAHKLLGRKAARTLVITAAIINMGMALYFLFLSKLPPDPTWMLEGVASAQAAFAAVLSPAWRIVLASLCAEVVSELLDTELYHVWVTRVTRRFHWARVLVSNSVSVPVDSLIFCWIAFAGVLPNAAIVSIFWANVLMKGLTTLLSLPGIYLVKERELDD